MPEQICPFRELQNCSQVGGPRSGEAVPLRPRFLGEDDRTCTAEGECGITCCFQGMVSALLLAANIRLGVAALKELKGIGGLRHRGALLALRSISVTDPDKYFWFRMALRANPLKGLAEEQPILVKNC